MKNEFNVGDKVWWAKYERLPVKNVCPICDGKLRVTIILGNGDHIETDCTFCERGCQKYGWVENWEFVSAVEQVPITRKEVNEGESGRQVEYRYNNWCLDHTNTHETKEGAELLLETKIAKQQQEDLQRLEYGKNANTRKYSWLVGYYQRQKRDAEKTIQRCDQKVAYLKSNAEMLKKV